MILLRVAALLLACMSSMPLLAQDVETKIDRARLQRVNGDAKSSANALESVVAQHPENFRAAYNLALAYLEAGDPEKADLAFKSALKLKSGDGYPDNSIYNSYGWMLLQQGNMDAAKEQFDQGLKHVDALPEKSKQRLYNNVGVLNLQSGSLGEAKKYFGLAEGAGSETAKHNIQIVDEAQKIRSAEDVK